MARVLDRERTHESGIGARVPRVEDDRLLRGEGRFTDDVDPAHALHMAVGRCPFPRARVLSVDVSEALALEGVEHVLVGSEVVDRTSPISVLRPVPGASPPPNYAMAADIAVYEGQPVVSVVAVDRYVAEDAIERIVIEYDPLPHVSDVVTAMADGPILHPDLMPTNLLAAHPQGAGDPELRLGEADVVLEASPIFQRATPGPTAATTPAASRPGSGEWPGGGGYEPCRCNTSGRLTPAAATSTRIWPGPGCGTGRLAGTSTSGPPLPRISIAVMVCGMGRGMARDSG